MIYIAHRGNISGPNPEKENHPDYIRKAIHSGYQVELDVWLVNKKFVLGHDKPQYEVSAGFLHDHRYWIHCKNIEAISAIIEKRYLIHCFFHDTDDCVLTSQGWIWTYPGKSIISSRSIVVMPERIATAYSFKKAGGICSDYVAEYKKNIDFNPNFLKY
jgi:hypothetical protein